VKNPNSAHQRLTPSQRNAFIACFLGWSLDAFDFFIFNFCITAIAADFHVKRAVVVEGTFWTLAMRPLGALIFGALAERWGRRRTLMLNVISFSIFELASAFAPTLTVLMVTRALFGIAMGGEWGVGAALAFETLPKERRGFFSGLLQEGYVTGNLIAGLVYALVFPHLHVGGAWAPWRTMFIIGAAPTLLVFYIRSKVEESPAWVAGRGETAKAPTRGLSLHDIRTYLPSFVFLVLLMTAFTSFSHGSQDLYPTFLQADRGTNDFWKGMISNVSSVGALAGGITFGSLSEKIGRRRAIILAALLAIPMIPLWAWTHHFVLIATGGFLMQFAIQGAWGVVPAYLNEMAPSAVRATFPGVAYQLGNLLSSRNDVFQEKIAEHHFGGDLTVVLSATVAVVAVVLAIMTALAKERKGLDLSQAL